MPAEILPAYCAREKLRGGKQLTVTAGYTGPATLCRKVKQGVKQKHSKAQQSTAKVKRFGSGSPGTPAALPPKQTKL
jgi:hypothetical protein